MIGILIRNKLTGANGIIIDEKRGRNEDMLKIYYLAEEVPLCNLIGRQLFSYAGKICFSEFCNVKEIEIVEEHVSL